MLIRKSLHLHQIVRITWKVDLLMLALCIGAHYVDITLIPSVHIPPALPTLMGTAIAFFIGFNNNQAYVRWWEARIIWGALVNESRSWARNLMAFCSDESAGAEKVKAYQRTMIHRHIAFVYYHKASLRKTANEEYKKYITPAERGQVEAFANRGNAILDVQALSVENLKKENIIDNFQFLTLTESLRSLCAEMGKSERIKNTVFPTTYVYFTRLFIWIFVILLTMSIADSVGLWSIFLGWIMGFVFHVTHINGMMIMNPFDDDPASVPIDSIARTIEINLLQTLGEKNVPEPIAPVNNEYIM